MLWQQRQRHLGSARQDVSGVLHCCRVDVFEASTEVSYHASPIILHYFTNIQSSVESERDEILLELSLTFRFVAF